MGRRNRDGNEPDAPDDDTAQSTPSGGAVGSMPMAGMNPMMMMAAAGMNPMMQSMQGAMNPLMMMQGGVNPMMMGAMQPMMMGMMPGCMNPMMLQSCMNPAVAPPKAPAAAAPPESAIDPRVRDLCRGFGIDDRNCRKLNEAMKSREDFDDDLQALWEVMEKGVGCNKKPLDVLLVKIREIERGTFAGKDLLDPDIKAFSQKYHLDDRVLNKLIETMKGRGDRKKQDLKDIDNRLDSAKHPAGLLVRLLEGLEEKGRMPSPPRWLAFSQGGSGHRDRAEEPDFERERRDRDREREGGRRRSRSRNRR